MSRHKTLQDEREEIIPGESVLTRWSRRKNIADQEKQDQDNEPQTTPDPAEYKTDADMPPIEDIDERSNLADFFSPEVSEALQQILSELPEMTDGFEKPCFFSYNPDICAHGIKGNEACRRCLDACPTGAIQSLPERIEVNPYWCQGGGVCAAACPTGALTYAYPTPADLLNRIRQLLQSYRASGGMHPVLLLHDSEQGRAQLNALNGDLPGHVMPLEIEELGSVGMDAWLAALAYGASRIILLETAALPTQVRDELEAQRRFATAILQTMNFPVTAIAWSGNTSRASSERITQPAMPNIELATFSGMNDKRSSLYFAIDHLYSQALNAPTIAELPQAAPFGEVIRQTGQVSS